ncbi:response regulator [Rhodospirillum rubrum]|uniref:Response regulator receiver domain protein (CheY) n=1 Tax=Rhodospirillum rubrum (strain ATCC 11170 / ATH 1.1.1 / DSM 467 / LMG 4362 / NCIMB 8255 / S1) TaxID=269796 RepID=Q2RP65_RHORT|nr:response regulator [Rhodospirillum rubrum]ABC24080.1 Response regulator receiver domain protein (CheY) [Rhodospirillum rubrum ATCC 11170]AEO49826.1 two-component response regulator [Rhodospirillum rubrum F11]MBK5955765.1 response regulator [Rhodospirillum rubrum]QXG80022.1 response regulator [Rhodospirillum rubrum]HAQ01074.1 response regulator [Rhodospirillum rubrum]
MPATAVSQAVVHQLPFLRRYARALCGDQIAGDEVVKAVLEVIVADPRVIPDVTDLRVRLYQLFHKVWMSAGSLSAPAEDAETDIQRRVSQLPAEDRQALLLVAMEGFTLAEAAMVLGRDDSQTAALVDQARLAMAQQESTRVLVIEDEPIIGLDIANIVESMGHRVVGIAATRAEAEAMALEKKPGLVLADIQLADGSSGIDAARSILAGADIPIVFITAYPERLLTGQRPEPTYLVTKPFAVDTVKVTIAQALFFRQAQPVAAE